MEYLFFNKNLIKILGSSIFSPWEKKPIIFGPNDQFKFHYEFTGFPDQIRKFPNQTRKFPNQIRQ